VKDADQKKVGKPFTTAVVESALGAYPGMFPTAPPGEGTPFGVYWPTLIDRADVAVQVTVDGSPLALAADAPGGSGAPGGSTPQAVHAVDSTHPVDRVDGADAERGAARGGSGAPAPVPGWVPAPTTPLGEVVGARSGDKGGNANVGVWIPEPGVGPSAGLDATQVAARYAWLEGWLTPEKVHQLLPEAAGLPVDVHPLPNLHAVNVVIRGLLGRGVADATSLDPQAKGLGEHLRARLIG
jgi:hypothetical protein